MVIPVFFDIIVIEGHALGEIDASLPDVGKRKYVKLYSFTIFGRRTSGSYSFGYSDMNSILRSAHAERVNRLEQQRSMQSAIDQDKIVCIPVSAHFDKH